MTWVPRPPIPPLEVRAIANRCELEAAFEIRHEVFVGEQGVPVDIEVDGADRAATTVHVVALAGGAVVGTGRLLTDPAHPGLVHVGRLAVRRGWRGRGVGRALMGAIESLALAEFCVPEAGARRVRLELSAQEHAIPFYAALGYELAADRHQEAGIWHRRAAKELTAPAPGSRPAAA